MLRSADLARKAAGRLHFIATLVLALLTIAAITSVAMGAVVMAESHDRTQRVVGGGLILGGVLGWLFSLLPYLAAQALARYIEFRVEAGGRF